MSGKASPLRQPPALSVSSPDLSPVHMQACACLRACKHTHTQKETDSLLSTLIKTLTLSVQGPTCRTSFNLNYFHRGSFPNTATLGFSMWLLDTNTQFITPSYRMRREEKPDDELVSQIPQMTVKVRLMQGLLRRINYKLESQKNSCKLCLST